MRLTLNVAAAIPAGVTWQQIVRTCDKGHESTPDSCHQPNILPPTTNYRLHESKPSHASPDTPHHQKPTSHRDSEPVWKAARCRDENDHLEPAGHPTAARPGSSASSALDNDLAWARILDPHPSPEIPCGNKRGWILLWLIINLRVTILFSDFALSDRLSDIVTETVTLRPSPGLWGEAQCWLGLFIHLYYYTKGLFKYPAIIR